MHKRPASYGGQANSSAPAHHQLPSASSLGAGFAEQSTSYDQLAPLASRPVAGGSRHKKSASDTFAFAAGELLQVPGGDLQQLLGDGPALSPFMGVTASALQRSTSAASPAWPQQGAFAGGPLPNGAFGMGAAARVSDGVSSAGLQEVDMDVHVEQRADTSRCDSLAAKRRSEAGAATSSMRSRSRSLDASEGAAAAAAAGGDADGTAGRPASTQTRANAYDTNKLDPRRAKRILANRQSAQRSRMKRLQYIHDLEKKASDAQAAARKAAQEAEAMRMQHKQLQSSVHGVQTEVSALEQQLSYQEQLSSALHAEIAALQQRTQQLTLKVEPREEEQQPQNMLHQMQPLLQQYAQQHPLQHEHRQLQQHTLQHMQQYTQQHTQQIAGQRRQQQQQQQLQPQQQLQLAPQPQSWRHPPFQRHQVQPAQHMQQVQAQQQQQPQRMQQAHTAALQPELQHVQQEQYVRLYDQNFLQGQQRQQPQQHPHAMQNGGNMVMFLPAMQLPTQATCTSPGALSPSESASGMPIMPANTAVAVARAAGPAAPSVLLPAMQGRGPAAAPPMQLSQMDVGVAGLMQDQEILFDADMVPDLQAELEAVVDLKDLEGDFLEAGMDFLEGLSSPSPDLARQTMSN